MSEKNTSKNHRFVTAEAVRAGHPDKFCDQLADRLLDECLSVDPNTRAAIEVMAADGKVLGASELLRLSKNRAEIDRELSVKPIQEMVPEDIESLRYCAKRGHVAAMRLLGLALLDGSAAIASGVQGM